MNHITFTDSLLPGYTQIELILTKQSEVTFKEKVFPILFDGKTIGSRTFCPMTGRARYLLQVYDAGLVHLLKSCMFNAILLDNGQMN